MFYLNDCTGKYMDSGYYNSKNIPVQKVATWNCLKNIRLDGLDKDVFVENMPVLVNNKTYSVPIDYLLKSNNMKLLTVYSKSINDKIKPKVSYEVAMNAAKRVTNDRQLQKALIELVQKEAIVIRTKKDALPIMKEQYEHLPNKENAIVLNINPLTNSGMQKSNTLMSSWYTEANNISPENLVTLKPDELRVKTLKPNEICEEWVQNNPQAKKLERLQNKIKPISMDKTREILNNIKGKTSDEILSLYSENDIAAAIKTMNENIVAPQKKIGYIGSLISQLEAVTKDKNEVTVVIPDDCSLSGSSMLCDTVKIFDKFMKNNPTKKVHVVFSPLILGDIAQSAFETFMNKDIPINDMYLKQINAIKSDGTEAFAGVKGAFERIKSSDNISFEVTPNTLKAKHFTETDYFKRINDPVLKSHLTYLLQGPIMNGSAQFGGFGNCGTLVITPTEEFELEGKVYAGKIPTNSVGFMETLGHEAGVLNDETSENKGLFTKGTGKGYTRYCEWEGLAHPESPQDRIPIKVNSDGSVSVIKQ